MMQFLYKSYQDRYVQDLDKTETRETRMRPMSWVCDKTDTTKKLVSRTKTGLKNYITTKIQDGCWVHQQLVWKKTS